MVSLDDAVLARLEKGGKRYEVLVDPDLVDQWKSDSSAIDLDDFMAWTKFFTMHVLVNAQLKKL